MIYFLRYKTPGCPIKIGYTEDRDRLKSRLRAYGTCAPWDVEGLAYIDGGRALERDLHTLFGRWRTRAEWFEPNEPLLLLVAFCRNNPDASRGMVIDQAMALVREWADPEPEPAKPRRLTRRAARKKGFQRALADGTLVIKKLDDA